MIFYIGLIGTAIASNSSQIIRDASFNEFMDELVSKLRSLKVQVSQDTPHDDISQIKEMEAISNEFIKKVVYDFGPRVYKAFYDAEENLESKYFIWNETLQMWHLPNQIPGPIVHGSSINAIILGTQIQSLYTGFINNGTSSLGRRMFCGTLCGFNSFKSNQKHKKDVVLTPIDDHALTPIQKAYMRAKKKFKMKVERIKKSNNFDPKKSREVSLVDSDDSDSTQIISNRQTIKKRELRKSSNPPTKSLTATQSSYTLYASLKKQYLMKAASILNFDWMIIILERFFHK